MKWQEIPTPCYVVDEKKLKQNLKILQNLEQETGCHVLLAQKAFSMFSLYPLIGQYISMRRRWHLVSRESYMACVPICCRMKMEM